MADDYEADRKLEAFRNRGAQDGVTSEVLPPDTDRIIVDLANNQKLWVRRYFGVVKSVKVWSDTYVSSSGGGGYIHPKDGGRVDAPTVSSTVTERQKFYLETSPGKEEEFDLSAVGVSEGHKLTIISGGTSQSGRILYVKNHTTDREAYMTNDSHLVLIGLPTFGCGLVSLLLVGVIFGIGLVTQGDFFSSVFGVAIAAVSVIVGFKVYNDVDRGRTTFRNAVSRSIKSLNEILQVRK
ncbi:hypothetical protein FE249_20455 (plasmid) [Acidiphilium multivorum]|uniref:hypothetical protein n=1 Tax=Acidiphilium multivorum TaxID=62140 RepID=UPI001F4BFF31|nr:hypothetical protein [Acidiphilium multivorum]UNC16552.1 hypothetical protein FE249_20455 [Acidiphilium multivorum]